MKRNKALEIGPMTSLLSLVDNDVIYSTTQFYNYTSNLRQYQLTGSTNGGVRSVDCQRPRRKWKVPQSINMTWWAVGTGRRIIGQFAGHTIHLEIEECPG